MYLESLGFMLRLRLFAFCLWSLLLGFFTSDRWSFEERPPLFDCFPCDIFIPPGRIPAHAIVLPVTATSLRKIRIAEVGSCYARWTTEKGPSLQGHRPHAAEPERVAGSRPRGRWC